MPVNWRKRIVDGVFWAGLAAFGLALLFSTQAVSAATVQGLELCLQVLLPSLFPFFVVSALLTRSGAAEGLAPWMERPLRLLFGLPGSCAPALLLGAVGGYPVGAKTVSALRRQKLCSPEEAVASLRFCNNAGPAFFIGAVGGGLLKNPGLGARLYAVHLGAAFLIGILYKHRAKSVSVKGISHTARPAKPEGFLTIFLQSVTQSFSSFGRVCGFVLFFSVIMGLLRQCELLYRLLSLLPGEAAVWQGLLFGGLEVTSGAALLANLSLSPGALLPALSFLCGWGGLSVQCQSISLLQEAGLPCGQYLRAKLLHGLLAAGLSFLFFR